jgi:hypothetical protein
MKFKHTCLDGQDRSGQELDCPVCRALLLVSFRGPDRPVDRRGAHPAWLGAGVEPVRSEYLYDPEPPAAPPGPAGHVVQCRISGTEDSVWSVACSCGWNLSGRYPAGEEASGRAVAEALALAHALNPEGDR